MFCRPSEGGLAAAWPCRSRLGIEPVSAPVTLSLPFVVQKPVKVASAPSPKVMVTVTLTEIVPCATVAGVLVIWAASSAAARSAAHANKNDPWSAGACAGIKIIPPIPIPPASTANVAFDLFFNGNRLAHMPNH